jgi:TonB-linked SusC/RagA family outer membrane protein
MSLLWLGAVGMAVAQQTVSGKVTSGVESSGLPGVAVQIKGTSKGVTTDIDGNYSLEVPNSQTILVFSFYGYNSEEVTVGNRTKIDVELMEDIEQLDAVVVTGYTQTTKEKLTGSVATVEAKQLEQVPLPSVDQLLQGTAPGVYVSAGSGQPGAGATVRIRGSGSINGGNDPLYILDGVPIDPDFFNSLNPNDFASINILKDPSSTAVYGSRAANGVVVITSKKGKVGRTQFNYRFQQGWSVPTQDRFNMMNTAEKIKFERFLFQNGIARGAVGQILDNGDLTPEAKEQQIAELSQINTDWRDEIFRTGSLQSHEINANGGNDKTRFYISGNYLYQEGISLRSDLERITGRFNIDHEATENLRFGVNATVGYSDANNIESEAAVALANPFAFVYLANPYERPRDPETGEFVQGAAGNAVERLFGTENQREELKTVGSLYAEYDILDGLTARTRWGVDFANREYFRLIRPGSFAGSNSVQGNQGSLGETRIREVSFIGTTTLNYIKSIGSNHDIDILVGNEVLDRNFNRFGFTGFGLNEKLLQSPAGITPGSPDNGFIPSVFGDNTDNALLSYFATGNYAFDDKYMLSAGVRRDASSRFGSANRWGTFWNIGAGWIVTNEDFLSQNNTLSFLKLRASYGVTGNQEGIGNFQSLGLYGTSSYNGVQGIVPVQIENPELQWERSNSLNIGVDYGLFNDRVTGTVDVYNTITSDLFINTNLSRTSGFSGLLRNVGEVRNRGIEVSFNTVNIEKRNFRWTTSFNFTYNQNEVLDLFQEDEFELGTGIIREGLPLGTHYVVKWGGVDPATGNPLYYDLNGNLTPNYSDDDRTTFGTWEAPRFGGFNNTFVVHGVTISAFFTYAHGNQLFNNQTFFQENPNFAQFNLSTAMLNIWQKPGDITEIQRLGTEREFSSKDLEDGSFLRLRNLQVGYNLKNNLLNRTPLKSVRIYGQAQNLLTFTNFSGFDPEDSNNIATYQYPVPRIYTVGVDIGF